MEVCYQLPVLPLDRPVPKHVLSRRGAISFSSSSSLFGAPDPRQLAQVKSHQLVYFTSHCGWLQVATMKREYHDEKERAISLV
ncbi:high affinity cAMP-specific 3',5'-cyclic phosphodiesterase 7A isoform X1 [Tachysurus ichikawai]